MRAKVTTSSPPKEKTAVLRAVNKPNNSRKVVSANVLQAQKPVDNSVDNSADDPGYGPPPGCSLITRRIFADLFTFGFLAGLNGVAPPQVRVDALIDTIIDECYVALGRGWEEGTRRRKGQALALMPAHNIVIVRSDGSLPGLPGSTQHPPPAVSPVAGGSVSASTQQAGGGAA